MLFMIWTKTYSLGFTLWCDGNQYGLSSPSPIQKLSTPTGLETDTTTSTFDGVHYMKNILETLKSKTEFCSGRITKPTLKDDWQAVDQTTHVYSAFVDPRNGTVAVIRVIAMMLWADVYSDNRQMYFCQIHIFGHTVSVAAHIRTYGSSRETR
jgi:hypothetical protein